MSTRLSGPQQAEENIAKFERYLATLQASGKSLPLRKDGQVNVTQVASDSGLGDRGRIYTNDRIRALLEEALRSMNVAPTPAAETEQKLTKPKQEKALERRVHLLEQQNAALVAENAELRRQLKALRLQIGREDMMIESGRRIPSPDGHHG